MEKLLITLALAIVSGIPVCWAQSEFERRTAISDTTSIDHPWEFSHQGQGVFPMDEASDRFDNTVGASARLMSDINPYAAIGIEGGWLRYKDEIGGVNYGRLNGFPVLADLELKMPIANNMIVPYAIAGAGVVFWN